MTVESALPQALHSSEGERGWAGGQWALPPLFGKLYERRVLLL